MKKIVIIGGGFTGTQCAKSLEKDFEVILIDNKPYFEFTPGILRTILEPSHMEKIQSTHKDYLKKSKIVIGNVSDVSEKYVKVKNKKIDFDYLIISSGSDYSDPIKEPEFIPATRAKDLARSHEKLRKAKDVLIVGGGLVGVELAAEICTHYKDKNVIVCHSRDELINRNQPKAKRYAEKFLMNHGVKIIFGERGKKKKGNFLITEKGTKIHADMMFMCIGIKSNYEFMKKHFSRFLTERNQIKVNNHLQIEEFKNIFSGGDISGVKEEKTAQSAGRQAETIIRNIYNLEDKKPLEPYSHRKRPMLISLGKRSGILDTGNFVLTGFIPAVMKWFVEWKTMRKYH